MPTDVLASTLDSLGSAADVFRAADSAFRRIAGGLTRVVIVGCGHLGSLAFAGANRAGLKTVAFADNNPERWRTLLNGVPVMSPADAVSANGDDTMFVVAIYNGTRVRQQLAELGCKRIVPYPLFFWRHADHMPEEDRLERPHRVLQHAEALRSAYALLADDRSRNEFAAQVEWRCTLDYGRLSPPDPASEMYFPPDLVHLSDEEAFVDCGAFDGDSIRMFLDKASGAFRHIYAMEPDSRNRACLKQYLSTLPGPDRDRISVLPFAVSDRNATASFDAAGTVGSRIVPACGSTEIECRRLDDLFAHVPVTLIKMDIEGAEPDALRGAMSIVNRARPILAVCAYHKCEHLWTLPPLLKAAAPGYHVYLRRYAEECWETVYYALPEERVVA